MIILPSKVCRDCAQEKPLSEFYFTVRKGRSTREYMARCKVCSGIYLRGQYYKHRPKRQAYYKAYRAKNGDIIRARDRARWAIVGRAANVTRRMRYREDPKERARAIANADRWKEQNGDKRSAISARYTKRAVAELREWYVKRLIMRYTASQLDKNDIPPSLVAAWAAYVKLKRLVKQQEHNEKCS